MNLNILNQKNSSRSSAVVGGVFLAALMALGPVSAQVQVPAAGSTPVAPSQAKQRFFRPRGAGRPNASSGSGVSITNAASYLIGVSPGGLATAFGPNLTDVTGAIYANSDPFPTVLANVSVTVNGVPAPIFSVAYAGGQDQISFQVPYGTPTGPGAADVRVYDYGYLQAESVVDSYIEDPGIFEFQDYGQNYAVALHSDDYSLVTVNNPAVRGEVLILYVTGLGPLNQYLRDGVGAPYNPLAYTIDPYSVVINGENANVLFSGLAPGYVGLYQINMQLPGDLPVGDLNLTIYSDYANSQTVLLSLK